MIIVNGQKYNGKNITINNGNIIIDGKSVTPENEKVITIHIDADIDSIDADVVDSITVTGDVGKVKTMSGGVVVNGDVNGDVKTMSGGVDVEGSISGNVKTMSGNIKSRK